MEDVTDCIPWMFPEGPYHDLAYMPELLNLIHSYLYIVPPHRLVWISLLHCDFCTNTKKEETSVLTLSESQTEGWQFCSHCESWAQDSRDALVAPLEVFADYLLRRHVYLTPIYRKGLKVWPCRVVRSSGVIEANWHAVSYVRGCVKVRQEDLLEKYVPWNVFIDCNKAYDNKEAP